MHDHDGDPGFSRVDDRENRKFVPDFFSVAPAMPHGAIVLSNDRAAGMIWIGKEDGPARIERFSAVGAPLRHWRAA